MTGTEYVTNTSELAGSLLSTWLERAGENVEASAPEHVDAMIATAYANGIIRPVDGSVSDGFHTFDDLYRHRLLLSAALWNGWANRPDGPWYDVHRSRLHHDGTAPFGGGWFIVVAALPAGQVSYHYELKHWDLFASVPERVRAAEFDGHSSWDVADRLLEWLVG